MFAYMLFENEKQSLIEKIKQSFKSLRVVVNDDIIHMYMKKNKKVNINNLIKEIFLQCKKLNIKYIIPSKDICELEYLEVLKKELEKLEINIFYQNNIMMYMLEDIFEYIINLRNENINEQSIYVMVKKGRKVDLAVLNNLLEKCKSVNIITDDLKKFRKIQQRLYEKYNMVFSVSNNRGKGLKRAKYVFNLNMTSEEIEKYKINRNAIIVNFMKKVKYEKNFFAGTNINDVEIKIENNQIEEYIKKCNINKEFIYNIIYEITLLQRLGKEEQNIEKIVKNDNVKISNLVGLKGIINNIELQMEISIDKL